MRVRHRHIIYVQGYDPRGLAQYYRMFRTELRKFAKLYQLNTTISRPHGPPSGESASWTIETKDSGWQTRTSYDFLRWEDLIQKDLAWPIWRTLTQAIAIYWQLVFSGTMKRFWQAHWRFAVFISYPHILLLNEAIWSAAIAFAVGFNMEAAGIPDFLAVAATVAMFGAILGAMLKFTESRTYLLYLMSDTIFTWQFAHRQRPDWDARIDYFAEYLVKVVRSSDAQEIVIVGHSSGSFLSAEIVARALRLDPDLGRYGPRVALLTLGGNMPIIGFHKVSEAFRNHLWRLAVEPSIDWVDCQSRKDVMNFFPFDPISGHSIDVGSARRNPTLVAVRFREIIKPENYHRFRWRFFRVHFQFVMANERPHAYDFFMIVCGPVPLMERVVEPVLALRTASQEPADRPLERKPRQIAPPARPDAAQPGKLEPSPGRPRWMKRPLRSPQ